MKRMEGSLTLEAAFIIPIVLIFVAAFIIGAMKLHDEIVTQVIVNQYIEKQYLGIVRGNDKDEALKMETMNDMMFTQEVKEKLWLKSNEIKMKMAYTSKSPIDTMQNIQIGWDIAGRMPILANAKIEIQNLVLTWQKRIKMLLETR